MNRFAPLFAAAFLACSFCPVAAQDNPYANMRTVGVISAFGNEVTLYNWGVTVFANDSTKLNLDWNLDAEVSQLVSSALQGRFAVRNVQADVALLRDMELKSDDPDGSGVPEQLRSLPSSSDVDAYIVVVPGQNSFGTAFGRWSSVGLGAIRKQGLFGSNVPITPYAAYDVLVVDAKNGKLLKWSRGNDLENRAHSGMMSSLCDKSIGVKTMLELTDVQKAVVRDELKFLVLSSLPNALKHVGLASSPNMAVAAPSRPSICLTP